MINPKQQIEILLKILAGNTAFKTCRGRLNTQLAGLIKHVLDTEESPSEFLTTWKQFSTSVPEMIRLLEQFRIDGFNTAYDELLKALEFPGYILPYEVIPEEETEPVSVVLLDPRRTMIMLKWIIEGHWMDLQNYVARIDRGGHSGHGLGELCESVFKSFPNLEESVRRRMANNGGCGPELCEEYRETILTTFSAGVMEKLGRAQAKRLQSDQFSDRLLIDNQRFVYIVRAGQSEVLWWFTKEELKHVAVWQIHLPKILSVNVKTFVGIHPEAMHGELRTVSPNLTSVDTSHGLGCIIAPTVMQSESFDTLYPSPRNGYTAVDSEHPYGILFDDPS